MANGPMGMPNSYSTRSTSHGMAPSTISRLASLRRAASMRLPTKPWQTPTSTGAFPSLVASVITAAIPAVEVLAPRTTSSRRMMWAGEKKWAPITCSGRPVAEAISSTSR